MKTRLIIAILAAAALFCSCNKIGSCVDCKETVKPSDLKPIDWNGWNDTYTIWHNLHHAAENYHSDMDSHIGDTIRCFGNISKYMYEDYSSFSELSCVYFECDNVVNSVQILFSKFISSSDRDSLVSILDSSSYSDTCFVKGTYCVSMYEIMCCYYTSPIIEITSIEDVYFKKSQP